MKFWKYVAIIEFIIILSIVAVAGVYILDIQSVKNVIQFVIGLAAFALLVIGSFGWVLIFTHSNQQ